MEDGQGYAFVKSRIWYRTGFCRREKTYAKNFVISPQIQPTVLDAYCAPEAPKYPLKILASLPFTTEIPHSLLFTENNV
jgi:hypothetical protein